MIAPVKPIPKVKWIRITKRKAKACFAKDEAIFLCPCKMAPGSLWNVEVWIQGQPYLDKAETYRGDPALWKGTLEETAWSLMYSIWEYHNVSWETGYYAHYYIRRTP